MEASQPETIRVQNSKGAMSLAQLKDGLISRLDEQFETVLPAKMPPPVQDPKPVPSPSVSPTPLPVKTVQPGPEPEPEPSPLPPPPSSDLEMMDETPAPETLPLGEEVGDEVIPPTLKESQLTFLSVEPLDQMLDKPLLLPLSERQPVFSATQWQSILRISARESGPALLLKREPDTRGFSFSLREIRTLMNAKKAEGLQLTLESGLMRRGETDGEVRIANQKTEVLILSLAAKRPVTLQIEGWRLSDAIEPWIRSPAVTQVEAELHLRDPSLLTDLRGFLRGARAFAVESLGTDATSATVHIVRGPGIVASMKTPDEEIMKSLIKTLRPDLVYQGPVQAFLGGKGSFDLDKDAGRTGDLFCVRRMNVLKLDRKAFQTSTAARTLIRDVDPYFMSAPVTVLYSGER
jgi:hypothetical protein